MMTNFYILLGVLKTFAYWICPLIIFSRGIFPAIAVEGSGWTGVLGYVVGVFWFILTWVGPVSIRFLEKFIGTNLAVRFYDLQTYVWIVLSIILLI